MTTNFKNLTQCLDFFKDEATCRTYLEHQRWGGTPACPFCGVVDPYRTNRGFKCRDKACHKKFTVTVGTIYENSKIGLRTFFAAIYLCTSSKKGVSSLQLSRQLGITQKTAWFVLHRVREMLREKAPVMLRNVVEVDETFIGGKYKNKHKDKKIPGAQGSGDKTVVFGAVQRHGKVKAVVIPDRTNKTLLSTMVDCVKKDSIMVSDEYYHSSLLSPLYKHVVIQHKIDEYVRGAFHTNTIEGFWAILKRGIYGIYHNVSPKHLQRYCDEFASRYNSRQITDSERFEVSIKNSDGRLKYDQLIGK